MPVADGSKKDLYGVLGVSRDADEDAIRKAYRQLSGSDIERVEDVVRGPHPILRRLPDPEPSSLPESLRRGSIWRLNDEGTIVSSYYDRRYELHIDAFVRKKQAEIARQARQRIRAEKGGMRTER